MKRPAWWPRRLGRSTLLGVRGLLAKELRSRNRGWRSTWLLTGYLGGLMAVVTGFLSLVVNAGGIISASLGVQLFSSLAVGFVLLLAFITPALTVGAISGERERRTFDLLLVTRASPLGLVGGKLAGSLFYVLFLLAASSPAFAVVYLFGGVPVRYLAMTMAVAAVTAVAHASLGLLLSAVLRRTAAASIVAYVAVFVIVLALPFAAGVASLAARQGMERDGSGQVGGPPPLYVYASPLLSLASVLPAGSSTPGLPLIGDVMRVVLFAGSGPMPVYSTSITRSVYAVASPRMAGPMESEQRVTTWAPWVYHLGYSAALTLFCLLGASLAVAPVKPWRRLGARSRP